MIELLEILDEARQAREAGETTAIATVIKIGGSTYRRPGARMLIRSGGRTRGTISGGCLEGEVAEQARNVIDGRIPKLVPFELGEDDLVLGFGTGCDGIVHVLIEPLQPGKVDSIVDLIDYCIRKRRRAVIATIIDATGRAADRLGSHLLVDEAGVSKGSLGLQDLEQRVLDGMRALLDADRSGAEPYEWRTESFQIGPDEVELLLEIVRPPIRLLIYGEGHDTRAMVRAGKVMGWHVVVSGRKATDLLEERFPEADEHRFLMHPEEAASTLVADDLSAAVVMNHTYLRDRDIMHALVNTTIPYVGLLGPRERTERMLHELTTAGKELSDEQRQRLFGPIGLDIGTETPEEIALATVAEIQAVLHNRAGGSLRERTTPIHANRIVLDPQSAD